MKISIVTACYKSSATLRDALESVRSQRLPEGVALEHVVVDGGSDDGTVDVIGAFERRPRPYDFRWISEKDRGMYDAINKGIRMATGEVVGILNADDWLDGEDVIARIASEFARTPDFDCLYGNVRFVAFSPSPSPLAFASSAQTTRVCFARLWPPWMLQWGYMAPHPAIFIRRECFEKWGGYVPERTEYRIAADYELLIRYFRVHRMRARYMPVCTTVMRPGGLSTKDVEARRRLNAEIIKGNRANGYFCVWPMLLPKYAIKIWEYILPRLNLV